MWFALFIVGCIVYMFYDTWKNDPTFRKMLEEVEE
jgi:hypothetical protein